MLDYYRTQSELSDPGKFASYFDELPNSIEELCKIVQNTFFHIFWIKKKENYGFTPADIIEQGRDPSKELNIRNIEEKLKLYYTLEAKSFTEKRKNINRVIGNCRDFALLLVSMLRHKGIPARVRSGAAMYFFPLELEKHEDHYICEYWNDEENRWKMVDPQLDELQRKVLQLSVDFTLDLPYEQFLDAGRTWLKFRKGDVPPENFGIFEWRGEMFALNKLIMDLASLNKVEVLAWESWGICGKIANIKKLGYDIFDELAENISQINDPRVFFELKDLFENDDRYKVPENYKPWFMKFES